MAAKSMRKGRARWWPALLLITGLVWQLVALYAPSQPGPSLFTHSDKVGHVLIFALPAAVATAARLWPRAVVVFLIIQAPVSELLQAHLLASRHGDVADVVADLIGIAVGVFIGNAWRRWSRFRRRSLGVDHSAN